MAFFTFRSSIQAEFTLETDLGMSMIFLSSPITSPTGLTVGRTCSSRGTSLTVIFSIWVTWSLPSDEELPVLELDAEVVDVVVVVEVAAGGVVPALWAGAEHRVPPANASSTPSRLRFEAWWWFIWFLGLNGKARLVPWSSFSR